MPTFHFIVSFPFSSIFSFFPIDLLTMFPVSSLSNVSTLCFLSFLPVCFLASFPSSFLFSPLFLFHYFLQYLPPPCSSSFLPLHILTGLKFPLYFNLTVNFPPYPFPSSCGPSCYFFLSCYLFPSSPPSIQLF